MITGESRGTWKLVCRISNVTQFRVCSAQWARQHFHSRYSAPRFYYKTKGAFVWDQSGIRIIGIMQVSVCLGAILIPEQLDFHFRIYSGISQTNAPKVFQIYIEDTQFNSGPCKVDQRAHCYQYQTLSCEKQTKKYLYNLEINKSLGRLQGPQEKS